jgi:hypothetical protein
MLSQEILCPDCGAELTLNETERREGKFACAVCRETFLVKDDSIEETEQCPNCGTMIPPGDRECTHCGWPEAMEAANNGKLVTVYVPMNEADHLAVGALLRGAGIDFYSQNAGVQNLFGAGQIGGFNLAAGPVKIQVTEENVGAAAEIIKQAFSQKDDRGEYEIPDICPGCNSPTKGLAQCPECSLAFVSGEDQKQREVTESEAASTDTQAVVNGMLKKCMLFSMYWILGIGSIFAIYYGVRSLQLIRQAHEKIKGKDKAICGIVFGGMGVFLNALYWYGWYGLF